MEMVNIKINGMPLSVPAGSTILEAARYAGINIPTLCWMKDLNEIGACRICIVELKNGKLVTSCVYPVEEGMEVFTNTPKVLDSRKKTLQLLLSNHNRSCLSCVRSGHCELQELAHELGVEDEAYYDGEITPSEIDTTAAHMIRDNSKCILCRRCVAACEDQFVGVIGPNGVGKTTLFRLIMGIEKPLHGTFSVGETVKLAYVDQQHASIDPEKTVYQVISQDSELIQLGGRSINARAYVSRFNFSGADQEKKCGVLSGGERNRLHLALALKEEGNVLLLDEPTNDIDVNTLRALEEGLQNFAGCAVVISHDRWFLDRIATHILAFEGDSQVVFFEGGYSEYEENKRKRLGDDQPHRVKYRKLMAD